MYSIDNKTIMFFSISTIISFGSGYLTKKFAFPDKKREKNVRFFSLPDVCPEDCLLKNLTQEDIDKKYGQSFS